MSGLRFSPYDFPRQGSSGGDVGAAGAGLARGMLQGFVMRRNMEMQDEELKMQKAEQKRQAALAEQKMSIQALTQHLQNMEAGREQEVHEWEMQNERPAKLDYQKAQTANQKDLVTDRGKRTKSTIEKNRIANLLARKRMDKVDSDIEKSDLDAQKTWEELNRMEDEPDFAEKERIKNDFAKQMATFKDNLKDENNKDKRYDKVVGQLGKMSAKIGDWDEPGAYTQAQIGVVQAAGLDYDIVDNAAGGVDVVPIKEGEKPRQKYLPPDEIDDKVPNGYAEILSDGTVRVKEDGKWVKYQQR